MSKEILTTCTMPFTLVVNCPQCEGYIGWIEEGVYGCSNPECSMYGKRFLEPKVTVTLTICEEENDK